MKSYNYKKREGIKEISWDEFISLSRKLTEKLFNENIDVVVGIARAGLLPATTVSCMLRKEFFPIRITRRFNDEVVNEIPVWKTGIPKEYIKNKFVAVIDEITDTGKTMEMVTEAIIDK